VRQRTLLQLGDALLHHGVRAVLPFDVDQRLVAVGEHRVVPPHREVEGLLVQRQAGRGLPLDQTTSRAVTGPRWR
jgi:hypothetical protein